MGGVADWFAVTALFREVPIPIVRRHTNIIAKNRTRIVATIADMVQNRWLSPVVISEHLAHFSASQQLLDRLSDPSQFEAILSFLRDLFRKLAEGIDRPEVSGFLERALKDQLEALDFARPLGNWMGSAIRSGDHQAVWETVLSSLEQSTRGAELRNVLGTIVDHAIREYRESGLVRGFAVQAAEILRLFNRDELVEALLRELDKFLQEAQGNPAHPLRERLNLILLDFADGLAAGRPESVAPIENLRRGLIEAAEVRDYISRALLRLRETIDTELANPGSDLDRLIRGILRDQWELFRSDSGKQAALDIWVRKLAIDFVDKWHGQIGLMVQTSLGKLSDYHLASQIQEKVGADLQYIRLNGAVVGGSVGALIAFVRHWLP